MARLYDGSQNYDELSAGFIYPITYPIAIFARFRLDSAAGGSTRHIFGINEPTIQRLRLYIQGSTGDIAAQHRGPTGQQNIFSGVVPVLGQWYSVTAIAQGPVYALELYVDGVRLAWDVGPIDPITVALGIAISIRNWAGNQDQHLPGAVGQCHVTAGVPIRGGDATHWSEGLHALELMENNGVAWGSDLEGDSYSYGSYAVPQLTAKGAPPPGYIPGGGGGRLLSDATQTLSVAQAVEVSVPAPTPEPGYAVGCTTGADRLRLELANVEIASLRHEFTIPGVEIVGAAGLNGPGVGILASIDNGQQLTWRAPGSLRAGLPKTVPATNDEFMIIEDGEDTDKWLRVRVDADYLLPSPVEASVDLTDRYNNGLAADDVDATDAAGGTIATYAYTVRNVGATPLLNVRFWFDPAVTGLEMRFPPVETWSAPTNEDNALALGVIGPGERFAYELRRTVSPGAGADPAVLNVVNSKFHAY